MVMGTATNVVTVSLECGTADRSKGTVTVAAELEGNDVGTLLVPALALAVDALVERRVLGGVECPVLRFLLLFLFLLLLLSVSLGVLGLGETLGIVGVTVGI